MAGVKTSKRLPRAAPTPPSQASFVHGSWPSSARAPSPGRIKPAKADTRDYGKEDDYATANPFGNTSLTGRS